MEHRTAALTSTLLALGSAGASALAAVGCSEREAEAATASRTATASKGVEARSAAADEEASRKALEARLDQEYPLHGLVTGVQLSVREQPDPESLAIGWVRMGARIRLDEDAERSATCASGWYRLYPRGWVCAGEGVEVGEKAPRSDIALVPAEAEDPLPFEYYFVKEPRVPEYHRLPSRDEQRAAKSFADRLGELIDAEDERRATLLLQGELPGAPTMPAVVARYLERGFFVASTGVEVRAFRRFVRTTRGSFVKEARTEQRTGASFHGVELGAELGLPLAFALRSATPMTLEKKDDGSHDLDGDEEADVLERQTVVESWARRERVGDRIYHRLESDAYEGPRYVRSWFIGVAEKIEPPFELSADDEPWVHVDLGEQTLVLYRGAEPVFATLVSSGLDDHATPTGVFTVHKKRITDTMADLGPDAGDDRYRIEDVPWTQYFEGSVALHGAFWHNRFGLQRSHGCVNLSPRDAHRVFRDTWPHIPDGWHGVSTDRTKFRGSRVVVTR